MSDEDRIATRYHYQFIHNVFGHFFENLLDYFLYLYPRFRYSVIDTYDKAVEDLVKKSTQAGRETDKPNLPAVILNPAGDFDVADGSKQFFRFPNLSPGLVSRLYAPIYQDENVIVVVPTTRVKGTVEVNCLTSSFYEFADLKFLIMQTFAGENRPIYPIWINTFVILPPELYTFRYENDVTNVTYPLDWPNAGSEEKLVKTTNTHEHVYAYKMRPWLTLRGMSDASSRLGGTDKLPEYKLTLNIEYEVEIPSYVVLQTDYLTTQVEMNMDYASTFSENEIFVPGNVSQRYINIDYPNLDSTSSYNIQTEDFDTFNPMEMTSQCGGLREIVCVQRYMHIVTAADTTANPFEFTIDIRVVDPGLIKMVSYAGEFDYYDHYTIIPSTDGSNTTTIRMRKDKVSLDIGKLIEIYVYAVI